MNNKVVLVTGSSLGIGKATILKFASNGYNVVINYLHHQKEANKLKEEIIKKFKVKVLTIKCDISSESEIKKMFKLIIKAFGKIDVLVNNAGIALDNDFDLKTKNDFMKTLEVNLVGTFLVSRIIGNEMLKNKFGSIINVASTNGIDSYYEYSLDYDTSKAGIINLTHNLANHYAPYIRVNCICPGWVDTPMNEILDDNYKTNETKKILLNRFAAPEEIANIIYFLASDEASYINDSIIKVDGGKNVNF